MLIFVCSMTLLRDRNICIVIRIHYYPDTLSLLLGIVRPIRTAGQYFATFVSAGVVLLPFVKHWSLVFIKTAICWFY